MGQYGASRRTETPHRPTTNKIICSLGSLFGSPAAHLNDHHKTKCAADLRIQWAQQGSNLRPLACKARTYRRWTWLDVARCGICQPRLWLDVAWRGLMPVDVGSPFSLAPLTFNEHGRRPETCRCSPIQSGLRGAIQDSAPDVRPRGLRQSAQQTPEGTPTQHRFGVCSGSSRLPATAEPKIVLSP